MSQAAATPASAPQPQAIAATGRSSTFSEALVALGQPDSAGAEAIRALRTRLVAQHFDKGRRALAICAPAAGVGCTFVATNLAVSFSQIGLSTLLVDANLRAPGVQAIIRPASPRPGLQETLAAADIELGRDIQENVLPNLAVLYAGSPASAPQELLASERFRDLAEYCMREFAVTIVDTPPANRSTDASRISNVFGYSLLVARRNVSLVGDVRTLASQLNMDGATVVGTALNDA